MTEYLTMNEVVSQCGKTIILIVRPAIFDRHIPAFDIAGFLQALTECAPLERIAIGRPAIEKSDHRHCRLLCARGKRPSDRCATESAMNSRRLIRSPRRRA